MPNDLTTPTEIVAPPEGMQVTPADFNFIQSAIDSIVGGVIDALGGPNFIPAVNPVVVSPTTGMGITLGGGSQRLIAQGRLLDTVPVFTATLAASNSQPRIDVVAVMATRVNSSSVNITRNVRADNAPTPFVTLTGTLVAGTVVINLPATYAAAPSAIAGSTSAGGANAGHLEAVCSTTQVTVTSDNSADTRNVVVFVFGNPTGSTGVSTTIPMVESQPLWTVVTGTPASSPAAPAAPTGYDAFAQILVHASETSIASGDINYVFPILPALSENLVLSTLSLVSIVVGSIVASGGITASVFSGSGAGLTGIPNTALVTPPVDTVNPGTGMAGGGSGGSVTLGLAHGDYVDLVSAQTIGGAKTFSSAPAMSGANITAGSVPDAALVTPPVTSVTADETTVHSTGGATPVVSLKHGDYVDETSTQTIGGAKTFSAPPVMSGANIGAATIPTSALVGPFTFNAAADGYYKFPNGMIVQWGKATLGAGPSQSVSLPIAFPTSFLWADASYGAIPPSGNSCGAAPGTLSTILIGNTSTGSNDIYWYAIGY